MSRVLSEKEKYDKIIKNKNGTRLHRENNEYIKYIIKQYIYTYNMTYYSII